MRATHGLTFLFFTLAIFGCKAPEAGPLSEEDVKAIRSMRQSFVKTILAGDSISAAGYFMEDAVFMPPNQPLLKGRSAIQTWFSVLRLESLTQTEAKLDGRDGLGYERGVYTVTLRAEGMTEGVSDTGKYIVIVQKQPDGKWLMGDDIWNSDQPLPVAPPAGPARKK